MMLFSTQRGRKGCARNLAAGNVQASLTLRDAGENAEQSRGLTRNWQRPVQYAVIDVYIDGSIDYKCGRYGTSGSGGDRKRWQPNAKKHWPRPSGR